MTLAVALVALPVFLYTWTSENAAVAHVDPATGHITAIAPGQTYIRVSGAQYGSLGAMRITVTAAP